MRLVTWNCQGGYRNKAHALAAFEPDIAVIQECETLDRLAVARYRANPAAQLWFGDYPPKGLAILSYSDYTFELDSRYDPNIRHCVPIRVNGHTSFNLLAVWAMNHPDRKLSYIAQVHLALERYAGFIREVDTVVVGDFNSNRQWDDNPRLANHSDVVATLADANLISAYHEYFADRQGDEQQATFYMHRKREKPYHLDYCFTPRSWIPRLQRLSIGSYEDWTQLSDHSPVFIEIADQANAAD